MPAKYVISYVISGLDAAPDAQAALCERVTDWDAKPLGEDRFSVRECLAHLADWDPIWLMRAQRTVNEDRPNLPGIDEGEMAIQNDYASSDPKESLRRYRMGRDELVAFFRSLPESAWSRTFTRDDVGEVTLFELAAMVLGHDGYHFRHTIEASGRIAVTKVL
jgi:uncharacterized damage-inducible protein DinB